MSDFPPALDKSHRGNLRGTSWRLKTHFGSFPASPTNHDIYLAQGLQPLSLGLLCGQPGQLLELQWGWGRGDVQEVGEGLAEGAGGQPLVSDPVAA